MMSVKRKSWPRFSLKILLAALTFCAAIFAVWGRYVEPYRQQGVAISKLESMEIDGPGADPFSLEDIEMVLPDGPDWQASVVKRILGSDRYVHIRLLRFPKSAMEEDIVFVLRRMPFLESVALERSTLSAETIRSLAGLPRLTELEAKYCDIDDREISRLKPTASSIQKLTLTGNPITNRATETLLSLESIETLYLRWTKMTQSGVELIRQQKAECRVFF